MKGFLENVGSYYHTHNALEPSSTLLKSDSCCERIVCIYIHIYIYIYIYIIDIQQGSVCSCLCPCEDTVPEVLLGGTLRVGFGVGFGGMLRLCFRGGYASSNLRFPTLLKGGSPQKCKRPYVYVCMCILINGLDYSSILAERSVHVWRDSVGLSFLPLSWAHPGTPQIRKHLPQGPRSGPNPLMRS